MEDISRVVWGSDTSESEVDAEYGVLKPELVAMPSNGMRGMCPPTGDNKG